MIGYCISSCRVQVKIDKCNPGLVLQSLEYTLKAGHNNTCRKLSVYINVCCISSYKCKFVRLPSDVLLLPQNKTDCQFFIDNTI